MIKAVSLLREGVYGRLSDEDVTMVNGQDDDSENEENDDDAEAGSVVDMTDLVYNIPYRRLGCLCHTLQLLIREVYNSDEYKEVLQSARKLVSKVRKSSIAMEKIVSKAGKTVINDNNTRWNSTFLMAQRLLQLRPHLNEVLEEMKIDSLLNSEWVIIEQVVSLLEPFRQQTDILQTDASSLSNVIPSLLELEYHLEQLGSSALIQAMKINLRKRFSVLLEPTAEDFNPLPAAACLLDPSCACVILGFDYTDLCEKAKSYIIDQVTGLFDININIVITVL
jgi:hypothetical protein